MRSFLIEISKRYPVMRVLRHYYVLARNWALWIRLLAYPVKDKTIVFQAYGGAYSCSPKALYLQLLKDDRFSDYSFVWVVSDAKKYAKLAANPRTKLVTIRSRAYYRAFAQSQYWIVNIMLPLRIVKRKNQTMVQCWHGTPLKRLRGDIIENTQNAMNSKQDFVRKNMIDTRRYDYFVSPSSFASEKFASAFSMQSPRDRKKIIEVGYPRNDALKNIDYDAVLEAKKQLRIPEDKKVLLYAPTWRDDQHHSKVGYTHQNHLDFDQLQKDIGDEFVVLFRAHYMIVNQFDFDKYKGFVFNVSAVDDINELYVMSDALVTDYSSVMFDFANLQRPILLYMYDLEHYEKQLRGFYIKPSELPGDILTTQERLTDTLLNLEAYEEKYREESLRFAAMYTYLDDGKASIRLIESVFDPPPILRTFPALRRYRPIIQQGVNNG